MFVTSPADFRAATGYPTRATATFDHITVNGSPAAANSWLGQDIGTAPTSFYPTLGIRQLPPGRQLRRRQRLR